MTLTEKYRPATWSEVIGQPKVLKAIDTLRRHGGLAGRAYWISGASGTGKTTIARLIAAEVANEFFVQEVTARTLYPSHVAEIEASLRSYGWDDRPDGRCGRAVIVNEAHGLRADTIETLLDALERIPEHTCWVFTTTREGEERLFEGIDAPPLLSRCTPLALTTQGLNKVFAARAREIAQREGKDGAELARYERLAKDRKNNFRAILQDIDAGCMLAE